MNTVGLRALYSWFAAAVALGAGVGTIGCAEDQSDPASRSESESDASVTVALTTVPNLAQCVRITATPGTGAATVRSFSLAPGASTSSLQVGPLLPGDYTLTADAFNVACSSVGTSVGNWIADAASVSVRAGVTAKVELTFRKNAPVTASANFVNNVQSIAPADSNSFIATDGGVLQSGHIAGSKVFTRANFSAFDSTSIAGNAILSLAATSVGACAVRLDGTVWCWGESRYGELGPGVAVGSTAAVPVQVTGLTGVTLIAAGSAHVCAFGTYNASSFPSVYCWGRNSSGQLGNSTTTDSQVPVRAVVGNVRAVACGGSSSYAVSDVENVIYSWGANDYGQLGDGTTTSRSYPSWIDEPMLQSVAAGLQHVCVLRIDGVVRCWGYNYSGQLGDGTTTNRLSPITVPGLVASQIVAGVQHSCALTTSGQTLCWGANNTGAIGDGSNVSRLIPTATALGGVRLASLASAPVSYNTCGIATDQNVYCWGRNLYGNLGDGTTNNGYLPVKLRMQ